MVQLRPVKEDLQLLKSPMGTLLRGNPSETMPRLRQLIQDTAPPKVITVGDVVSSETLAAGIKVHLRIVDYRTLRTSIASPKFPGSTYRTRNPAGVITMESWDVIKQAMKARSEAVILVEGEEDLLTLPCVLEAPDDSLIAYGQPSEGLVVVTATASKKREVATIMKRMTRENSSG